MADLPLDRSELGRQLATYPRQPRPPRERTCAVCGSRFETRGRGLYCGRACQVRAYRARQKAGA